jgi:very-short-patch-repair endonuclease
LQRRPDLADFFSLEREERFFVKNLETVQGDERDAIVISIGYGKTPDGDLPHRFGPLTQDIGYRRLNVAVTRARRRVAVISSFRHDEVDLNRSGGRGVQLLKSYLEYAANGGGTLPSSEGASEVPLNPFEADVKDALEARGIRLLSQYGASHYRIDLVAVHPEKASRPVLAIECDGASYHSGATARDRDRLRQQQLMRRGWQFHRIWSTDWFYHREEEVERALSAYEEAVNFADAVEAEAQMGRPLPVAPQPTASLKPPVAAERAPSPGMPRRSSIDDVSRSDLRRVAEWAMSDGLLRTDDELMRDMLEALGFERLGSKIRIRLEQAIREARAQQVSTRQPGQGPTRPL